MTENHRCVVEFERFFQQWLESQEQFVEELIRMERDAGEYGEKEMTDLIWRVLAHYQQYYEHKSRVVEQSVFVVLSPPWFTPLERTFLWIAGFKPGMAFKIVGDAVGELSEDQRRRMEELEEETRTEERSLNDELARVQESLAAPPLMQLVREAARLTEGPVRSDAITESLSSGLVTVVRDAELLRTTTAMKVVEILIPAQIIKFLTAVGRLHLKVRAWGLQRSREGGGGEAHD